jgi:hypothetical protein
MSERIISGDFITLLSVVNKKSIVYSNVRDSGAILRREG